TCALPIYAGAAEEVDTGVMGGDRAGRGEAHARVEGGVEEHGIARSVLARSVHAEELRLLEDEHELAPSDDSLHGLAVAGGEVDVVVGAPGLGIARIGEVDAGGVGA